MQFYKIDSNLKIYKMIRYLCTKNGIKIGELENKIGTSKGYISRVKSGARGFSLETALKIADYFEISVDELIKGPPIKTNADVFMEVFGFKPSMLVLRTEHWWDEEYKENEDLNNGSN